MAQPTQQDAQLMLQLAQYLESTTNIDGAPNLYGASFPKTYEAFRAAYPDETGPAWKAVRATSTFFETTGLLVRRGLFSKELALDWILVDGPWRALAPIIEHWRTEMGEPQLFEHFEWLAKQQTA